MLDASHGIGIETGNRRDSDGDRVTDTFKLDGIEDVAKVEELIRRIKDGPITA